MHSKNVPFVVEVQENLEVLPREIGKGDDVVTFLLRGLKQSAEHRGFFHQEMAVYLEATILDLGDSALRMKKGLDD
jgi:hypothetical protein